MIDVDAIDLANGRRANAHAHGGLEDPRREALPLGGVEPFGIIDATDRPLIGRHDDGTCDDGARERAPSDFIDPSDEWSHLSAELPFEGPPAVTLGSRSGACVRGHRFTRPRT